MRKLEENEKGNSKQKTGKAFQMNDERDVTSVINGEIDGKEHTAAKRDG
jgi:hypothetical protein